VNWHGCNLAGRPRRADLAGANLAGANLDQAFFYSVNLANANISVPTSGNAGAEGGLHDNDNGTGRDAPR